MSSPLCSPACLSHNTHAHKQCPPTTHTLNLPTTCPAPAHPPPRSTRTAGWSDRILHQLFIRGHAAGCQCCPPGPGSWRACQGVCAHSSCCCTSCCTMETTTPYECTHAFAHTSLLILDPAPLSLSSCCVLYCTVLPSCCCCTTTLPPHTLTPAHISGPHPPPSGTLHHHTRIRADPCDDRT